MLESSNFSGCSKMAGCKAPEVLRSESYLMYVAATKEEGNDADGLFSAAW
jgi:hypothetical protein